MDRALSLQEERQDNNQTHQPVLKPIGSNNSNPFSVLTLWVAKSLKNMCSKAKDSNGFTGMIVNNSLYCASPYFLEAKMDGLSQGMDEMKEGFNVNDGFVDGVEEDCRESSSGSDFLASEATVNEEHSSSEGFSSPPSMRWPVHNTEIPHCSSSYVSEELEKPKLDNKKLEKQGSSFSGIY